MLLVPPTKTFAVQAKCEKFNFSEIFYADYKSGSHWDNSDGNLEISWSADVSQVGGEEITRAFTANELNWIREGIGSWDAALQTVSFREVGADQNPQVVIGFVPLIPSQVQPDAVGFWTAQLKDSYRTTASIKMKSGSGMWFKNSKHFIHTVQHEMGNVLGLGDISPTSKFVSVLEDPWQPPYGKQKLSQMDLTLIRQMYGESKCQHKAKATSPEVRER